MKSKNKLIGITLGDPSGIGCEVAAKSLSSQRFAGTEFLVIGSARQFHKYYPQTSRHIHLFDPFAGAKLPFPIGKMNRQSGEAAYVYLQMASELLKQKKIDALVTAPVSKEAIGYTVPSFIGHTEFFAETFGVSKVGMLFVADQMKTLIVTRHVALKDVAKVLKPQDIMDAVGLTAQGLKKFFKISKPRIAVCGLNPHAGEGGHIGKEEKTMIVPTLARLRARRIDVRGPFAADTLFEEANRRKYDAIVAMYHDQGLIPIKTLYFRKLVNFTLGLPFVRTSPAHGTAFDIAGKNIADPSSMTEAIKLAIRLS